MLGTSRSAASANPAGVFARPRPAPRYWKQAAAENPLARFVPFSSLVSPHDVITRGGDYLRVWRLDGVPFECADEHLIAERHEALYVEGFGLSEAEYDIVRSLGAQGGRRFLVKQGHASAICELDLSGLDDFITVLSATTDNVALLDDIRARHGNEPFQWLPVLLREVQDRKSRNSRSAV